ncbi:MBL fold metallo-hydrolase [Luteimonas suaedae]|uniref:MBL fold metallo-hydrolase n=1 Tax=Luteimonas suaedae TaxID=2605430 RepID=UPI0011EEB384
MAYFSIAAWSGTHYPGSPQFRDGGFRNPVAPKTLGWRELPKAWWSFMFDRPAGTTPPQPPPVETMDPVRLQDVDDGTVFRLGHSTVLIKLAGGWWLTDPVFSERASPLQWAGPRRFHPPPITIAQLPRIRAVILSHDHYDHLDKQAVRALAEKTDWFLAPLGVGDLLIRWGVDPARVRQLDWWEATTIGSVRLVATPAQHFSGRRPFAGNPTLWASWVIQSPELRLFFSGDSGYFDGFREIGERYGPFDLTLLECGAYDPSWEGVHMLPEQTLQAHLDLRGRRLLPVHNGTFDLAMHRWNDPMERIAQLAAARGIFVTLPRIGQAVPVRQPPALEPWWRMPREQAPDAIGTGATAESAR